MMADVDTKFFERLEREQSLTKQLRKKIEEQVGSATPRSRHGGRGAAAGGSAVWLWSGRACGRVGILPAMAENGLRVPFPICSNHC